MAQLVSTRLSNSEFIRRDQTVRGVWQDSMEKSVGMDDGK